MGTVSHVIGSIPDTTFIAISPCEAVPHSCPAVTTQMDVALTHEITSTIILAISIIGIIVVLCIAIISFSKYKGQKLRLRFEEKKRIEDQTMQEYKNRLDTAWRYLNDFYKKKESGVTDSELQMTKASWEFLASAFKESQMPKSDISK